MSAPSSEVLKHVDQLVQKEFDTSRRILSFDEYLVVAGENPEQQTRSSAQYVMDMMDFYGKEPIAHADGRDPKNTIFRFKLFDQPIEGYASKLVGQEEVQTRIYRTLQSFVRHRSNARLILLHGPNGSAKSTLSRAIMGGLERYSHEREGAAYSFNWIFPIEKHTKGGIGIQSYNPQKESLETFARMPDEEVAARVPCELRDHPLLLIPTAQRKAVLSELLGTDRAEKLWRRMPQYLTRGDLCHRCKEIFEALLASNGGNYRRVLMHIQVERFYHSRRYRKGLVTVEPQLHVDASYSQLTLNRSISALPASLQSLNFFSLSGDLVDGNRGIIEYSDLLKRPIDTFKYLLMACETGSVNVGPRNVFLDTVMIGSSNELQLDAFKEFPDFSSFKARIELVRVPYLLAAGQEQEIYSEILADLDTEKHVAPHVAWTLALWATLTRLKKPNSINYPPNVSTLISNLTPLEKAKIYDKGEMPHSLPPEDRKLLRVNIDRLRTEYINIPYYEGRMGASVREIRSILYDALQNPEFPCLSPLAVVKEMEEFVKRVSEYEFLKQDVKDGYHDVPEFVNTVKSEYLEKIDREVRGSIGLYDVNQWEEFLRKYVIHISHLLKKEKVHNPTTGRSEDPDKSLISEFEKIVEAPKEAGHLDAFRNAIISRVGAWSLDHPGKTVLYSQVFPEYWTKLEKHYYETQKGLLKDMNNALQLFDTENGEPKNEGQKLAQQTVRNLKTKWGYCDKCAREVIDHLMRRRF